MDTISPRRSLQLDGDDNIRPVHRGRSHPVSRLGVFLAIRQKNNKAAGRGITLLEMVLIPHLREYNDYAGWIALYSKFCFEDFILATEANVEVYKDLTLAGRT
ncbi:hypothetical protein ES708_04851 [subsurface metagenome]